MEDRALLVSSARYMYEAVFNWYAEASAMK